jgi:glycine oxidase
MTSFDVVVVGNGALGSAVARALGQRDDRLRVAVVGPGARPRSASKAAGAMLGRFGEVTRQLRETEAGREKLALCRRAGELWPSWLASLDEDLPPSDRVPRGSGTFIVAAPGETESLSAIEAELLDHGERYERSERSLFIPNEAFIDATRLLEAYERASRAEIFSLEARRLRIDHGRVSGVELDDGSVLTASLVLLAAGVDTQRLLDPLPIARRIPAIYSGAGTAVVIQPSAPLKFVVRSATRPLGGSLHVVPLAGGRAYLGATNEIRLEPIDRPIAADAEALLLQSAEEIDPAIRGAKVVELRSGNRPVSLDGWPLIGGTSIEGLFIACGTYRDGLFLSPCIAADLASVMIDRARVSSAFVPERAPISIDLPPEIRSLMERDPRALPEIESRLRALREEHG